uniref:Protein translocase subunit SecA n=1 Tax=Ophidocladus simpliciusculus TaxID=1261574 RepID=A0A1Z1MJC0_9FLOR|nr:preprotein-translocase subunit a [Ophidocladus simpliciusculus]ARW65942.1 preprotein-translocase subunit a [Ophidocladus simpliciusculus]
MLNFLTNNPINKYKKVIKKINFLYHSLKGYSDEEIKQQTEKLRLQLKDRKLDTNEILSEAFATMKETIARTTGMVLFDVQLLGGIILHQNNIAEMKTGEGKTLVALLPAYLNSLTKEGVHIITVNEYLAERDASLAKKIFSYLNITVGLITPETRHEKRNTEYNCDITYITNSELGFDYLKDNMAIHKNKIIQRNFNYAIVDEIDSILIDEARTPLIISGITDIKYDLYKQAKEASNMLKNIKHYKLEEKSRNITLTELGVSLCEELLNIDNLYNINSPWLKYIINALKAKELFLKNKDYIIKNNQIMIVDEFTGRVMEDRRWSDGLHQSIEAKENIKIEAENKTLASITYQNLFLLYKKLCGMTGTAKTEENEFSKIYKMNVIEIPTNKQCIRQDLPDLVYRSEYYKWQAIANECFDMYKIGRPTLIGTTSIEKSELLSNILDDLNIPHNLLNAKPENITREAEIIMQAGTKYSITIATNMAGRGTDIILGGNSKKIAEFTIKNYLSKKNKTNITEEVYTNDTQVKSILRNSDLNKINNLLNTIDINKVKTNIEKNFNLQEDKKINHIYQEMVKEYSALCDVEKKEIFNLGGLYVIGTERHESRRIDNQLRGRSGRQGDRGTSRFFLSLQDNLFRVFGGKNIESLMKTLNINNNTPIESMLLSRSLNSAQKKVEAYFYDIRKQLFEYDEVINNQRKAIYTERKKILNSIFIRDCILEYGEYTIDEMLIVYEQNNKETKTLAQILQLINVHEKIDLKILNQMKISNLKYFLYEQFRISYDLKESYLEQLRPGLTRQLEKYYLLQQIDKAWQEHIDKMNLLKEYIGWRSYGQQDPLIEYKNEAFHLFINMITYIRQTVIYLLMRSRLIIDIQ